MGGREMGRQGEGPWAGERVSKAQSKENVKSVLGKKGEG